MVCIDHPDHLSIDIDEGTELSSQNADFSHSPEWSEACVEGKADRGARLTDIYDR